MLRETAPGITKEQVIAATGATLIIPEEIHEMPIAEHQRHAVGGR